MTNKEAEELSHKVRLAVDVAFVKAGFSGWQMMHVRKVAFEAIHNALVTSTEESATQTNEAA